MPVEVIQPGAVDPHAVEFLIVKSRLWASRQDNNVAATALEPFG